MLGKLRGLRSETTNVNRGVKKGKKTLVFSIDKRQKFVIAIVLLTAALFLTEFQFGKSGIIIALILSVLTNLFLYWAVRGDLKGNFNVAIFILPFFYSLAFALFYFIVPARLMFRLILSSLYAFGLYSLFLSANIFTVGSIRTIALTSGARIVSFVITLLSFFFLTNTIFTLHLHAIITIVLMAVYTFPLVYQSLWTYDLSKSLTPLKMWAGIISVCLLEAAALLWFWPSSPTIVALFMTGFLYTLVGLSHVWLEKRLFKGVLWEYVWVGVAVFFVLMIFTSWGK